MLSMKIFVNTPQELLNEIIERAVEDKLGLELLMIDHDDNDKLYPVDYVLKKIENTRFSEVADLMLHTDHCHTWGFQISDPETLASYTTEMQNANRLGMRKVVMHYNDKMDKEDVTDKRLHDDLLRINDLGEKYGITIHLENTLFVHDDHSFDKANIDFHERIFSHVTDEKMKNIGFCFDLGHGKVFSDNKLAEWLKFIDSLVEKTIPVHFHLHNNHGVHDDHMPFHIADMEGLNEGDSYTGGEHYLNVLNKIINTYKAMQLIEIPSSYALAEMNWLQAELAKLK